MSIEVKVPVLPESVSDATIAAWHKKPGDAVKRDENLADLETDKVVLEVPAPADGVLKEIKFEVGSTVTSSQLLAIIEEGAAAAAPAAVNSGAAQAAPAAAAPAAAKARISLRQGDGHVFAFARRTFHRGTEQGGSGECRRHRSWQPGDQGGPGQLHAFRRRDATCRSGCEGPGFVSFYSPEGRRRTAP